MGEAIGAQLRDHREVERTRAAHHQAVVAKLEKCEDLLRRIALGVVTGRVTMNSDLTDKMKPWSA